jgi:hypothetical protein
MVSQRTSRYRAVMAGVVVVAALSALAGCTEATPAPDPARPTIGSTPQASATAAPDPELVPTGDASANLAYFDFVNRGLLATVPAPNGQQIVETLVGAGFAKADMEITPDVTVGKEAAEAIQFSVRINGSCLVAQIGGAGYNAIAAPLLGTGKCLVGTTRTIDF